MNKQYAHPETVVETEWLAAHLGDKSIRVVEVTGQGIDYVKGHIPGAVAWDRFQDMEHPVLADISSPEQFSAVMSRSGIKKDTTTILYSDGLNRHSTWAFFVVKVYGHKDVRVLNGGKLKWRREGRPITQEKPVLTPTRYAPAKADLLLRATRDDVLRSIGQPSTMFLDVRTREEFEGRDNPDHPQTGIRRLGHIPGAVHRPWEESLQPDGSFKPRELLAREYESLGITNGKEVVTYCRLGVRASHSWFVLRYLLGNDRARIYDGSWNEWGNLVGAPIER